MFSLPFVKKEPVAVVTVDGAIADVVAKIEQLEGIGNDERVKADALQDRIVALEMQRNHANHESARAMTMASRFRALIAPPAQAEQMF